MGEDNVPKKAKGEKFLQDPTLPRGIVDLQIKEGAEDKLVLAEISLSNRKRGSAIERKRRNPNWRGEIPSSKSLHTHEVREIGRNSPGRE